MLPPEPVSAAITTSGELRFGTCLLEPPAGYVLADLEQGKGFVSDLLGGQIELSVDGIGPNLHAILGDLPTKTNAWVLLNNREGQAKAQAEAQNIPVVNPAAEPAPAAE